MAEVSLGDEMRTRYPPNKSGGHALARTEESKPAVQKVVTGKTKRTKSLGRKFADVFLGADVTDVKSFLIWDCLVPGVKYAFLDSILMLFGERGYRGGSSLRGRDGNGRSSYISYGRESQRAREATTRSSSSRYSPDDVVFETKDDAMRVLDMLCDQIDEYGEASVASFYAAADISSDDFTDNYWGWRDLSQASTRRIRDGWVLAMPKAVSLK